MEGTPAVLVDSSSATHGRPWEDKAHHIQALDRAHSNLIKFSRHDSDYDTVLDVLDDFSEEAGCVIERRLSPHEGTFSNSLQIIC